MVGVTQKDIVLAATLRGSTQWKMAFNSGNANDCAAQYEADAIMHARPFGTFRGTTEIADFWQKIIHDGFTDVKYLNQRVDVLDEVSAVLTAHWQMNTAQGVIHRELWVLQPDGTAKLREDDFEVQGN